MYEISDYMSAYIDEHQLSKEYLIKIGIPKNIVYKLPVRDKNNFSVIVDINDFLDEIEDRMNNFLWQELYYKDSYKTINDIKISLLMKTFDMPVCPFWLTFCDLVKTTFSEYIFS